MTAIAPIIVQLVHIQGPLKGEIQELTDPEIGIGRHPDCQVQFPKEMISVSRRHALIVREGNRFKLIDQSTNGTYVNGQRIDESYLKDGDVLTFAKGGPKLSFLTRMGDQPAVQSDNGQIPAVPPPRSAQPPPAPPISQTSPPIQPAVPPPSVTTGAPPPPSTPPAQSPLPAAASSSSTKVPFAIQYGPALKSFQTLPITLGKGDHCDFVIRHPALIEQHARIFFHQDRYWIRDLTGTRSVSINGMPCDTQAPLEPDAQVALSPQGPKFRFLAGGRLAEIEDPLPLPAEEPPIAAPQPPQPKMRVRMPEKAGDLIRKFFPKGLGNR
jgi:pSer/pThr/pTyr-binding forkhead associated (FHA) protein